MNKQELINKIKQIEGLSNDERAELVKLINTNKKYGLVWEDKPEDVEEQLRTQLPVLTEVVEKRILSPKTEKEEAELKTEAPSLFSDTDEIESEEKAKPETIAPNHIIIEGDNLHALTALTFTHEGKVDVIYIDPPYNTGNKDFKYNDSFVDKEDSYRHSKWLSFMEKRLKIAKKLLSEKGLIFISIDDVEYAPLKLLLDEIFNHNMINSITVKTSEASGVKMSHADKKLPKIKEYLLVYSKTSESSNLKPIKLAKVDDADKFKSYAKYYSKIILNIDDPVENWKIVTLKKYFRDEGLNYDEDKTIEFKLANAERIVYRTNNKSLSQMKFDSQTALVKSPRGIDYVWWEGKQMLFLKDYIDEGLCDLWTDISTINLNKEICGLETFENGQKPLELIKRIQDLYPNDNITVLDFFAGSGTTLHAAMQLNEEDRGNRQCILITNNENNICEEVTYERNKRVIDGYTDIKGELVKGLSGNNLRYYKSEFVSRKVTVKNKKKLVLAATDLLCIKEDIYSEVYELGGEALNKDIVRCFADNDKYMMVIYDEESIEDMLPLINSIESEHKIKTYIFAPGQYPFTEEFEDVLDKVELCALPDAIYKAYAQVLPKKEAPTVNKEEADSATEIN